MNYAAIKKFDIANGPGVRVSLFVSGCRHKCKNCFNSEAWDFNYGEIFTQDTLEGLLEAIEKDYIEGFSLLGGEPFEPQNQLPIVELLRRVKAEYPDKSIWAYSGYLFDKDILAGRLGERKITEEFLSYLDVLVDGPFIQSQRDLTLRFRGSSNQRLIDVPASLANGEIVLWQDWQTEGKGLRK